MLELRVSYVCFLTYIYSFINAIVYLLVPILNAKSLVFIRDYQMGS